MKKFKGFNSLRKKIMTAFLILIFLIFLSGLSNFTSMLTLEKSTDAMSETEIPLLIADERLHVNITDRIGLARAYVLYGDSYYKELFMNLTEESQKIQESSLSIEHSDELANIVEDSINWRDGVLENVFEAYDQGDELNARTYLQNVAEPKATSISNNLKELIKTREEAVNSGAKNIDMILDISRYFMLIVVVIVLIIGIIIAIKLANSISKPMRQLRNRMNEIKSGELRGAPLVTKAKDEIAQLIHATNDMQESLRTIVTEINTVSNTVHSHSEDLSRSSHEVTEASNQVAATMEELSTGAETQANTTSDLANSMIALSENIQTANNSGNRVRETSTNMMDWTTEGNQSMHDSINQMERIYTVVNNAVSQVKGLNDQSKQITQLVNVIKDVSEQTNLLALNAAIEAARAGEHGKGFAVVADEVRKLAEQVSNSVNDITSIVASIQTETSNVTSSLETGYKEVERGMEQVATTGEKFEQINSGLNQMLTDVKLISENLATIFEQSDDMNKSVEEIASISEQSAAGIEETTASVEETSSSMEEVSGSSTTLSKLAQQLKQVVGHFKVK
jgi:methyl-accepting chemotaxis protein